MFNFPAIGSTITVQSPSFSPGPVRTGTVTGHTRKDGRKIVQYDYDATAENGTAVKASSWASVLEVEIKKPGAGLTFLN